MGAMKDVVELRNRVAAFDADGHILVELMLVRGKGSFQPRSAKPMSHFSKYWTLNAAGRAHRWTLQQVRKNTFRSLSRSSNS